MAYTLAALVTPSAAAAAAIQPLAAAQAVSLAQSVSLIPLTARLLAELRATDYPGSDFEFEDLTALPGCAAGWAAALSQRAPVAFVAAEFFGGWGSQAAIGWQAGQLAFEPVTANDAINQALRWLGVTRAEPRDEFDALALGRYRDTEDWATAAQ
jgi:hypothetical protein